MQIALKIQSFQDVEAVFPRKTALLTLNVAVSFVQDWIEEINGRHNETCRL